MHLRSGGDVISGAYSGGIVRAVADVAAGMSGNQ